MLRDDNGKENGKYYNLTVMGFRVEGLDAHV